MFKWTFAVLNQLTIRHMTPIRQGEKLLLLVKRDTRSTEEIAKAMGVDKSYLPRLYQKEKLPPKPLRSAMVVFGVPESYFTENPEPRDMVSEPDAVYRTATSETARLRAEIAGLREEMARLAKMLEQEKKVSADLAEALRNLSKRK